MSGGQPRSNSPRFTRCANADQARSLIISSFLERSLESRTPTKPGWHVDTSSRHLARDGRALTQQRLSARYVPCGLGPPASVGRGDFLDVNKCRPSAVHGVGPSLAARDGRTTGQRVGNERDSRIGRISAAGPLAGARLLAESLRLGILQKSERQSDMVYDRPVNALVTVASDGATSPRAPA